MQEKWVAELIRQHYLSSVGRLMKGVLHNMNGPLQVLSIQVELLKGIAAEEGKILTDLDSRPWPSEESRKCFKTLKNKREACSKKIGQLEEQLQHLRGLTNMIVNRGTDGGGLRTGKVDLNAVIRDEVALLEADLFFKHQVRKILRLRDPLPLLSARYLDLSQALSHILQNAIEAVLDAEEREIIIETGLAADQVFVCIQDSGGGIPPAIREKLFTPFCTTKPQPHPGLGLFLTKRILDPLGVRFKIESKPGMNRMALYFPLSASGHPADS